ncbi:flagellar hook-associated protein FlgK [Pantoea sp. A4]|uniref:flagellar hook-associated protein FlgK n=1 Tax=Pantoea sp. A4 TaxID=1225184 RepID=UPI0003609065|nr:flagellar hook-associated protein FlgK [Pantoea sp. A4]
MSVQLIGGSALNTARKGMSTTAMNIANAATPGYSRQRLEQAALAPANPQRLASGQGVETVGIRRMADQFLQQQVWYGTTRQHYAQQLQLGLNALEKTVSSEQSGIASGLDNLFQSLSAATEKPDNQALRQNVLSNAKGMALRFNTLQHYLQKQHSDIRLQQQSIMTQANSLLAQLAGLNEKITAGQALGHLSPELRDRRDERVSDLSELIAIRINEQPDGSLQISLPEGHPLVSGSYPAQLVLDHEAAGGITIRFSGSEWKTGLAKGGELGALQDFLTQTLQPVEQASSAMAEALATHINLQLASGFDLRGQPGAALFDFNAQRSTGMMQVTDLGWEGLAFSQDARANGDNRNLLQLSNIKHQRFPFAHLGVTTLDNASVSLSGELGIQSQQNQHELDSARLLLHEVKTQRDSYSAVDYDEEYIDLTRYTQAYQAGMQVVSTGDRLFGDLLALF